MEMGAEFHESFVTFLVAFAFVTAIVVVIAFDTPFISCEQIGFVLKLCGA